MEILFFALLVLCVPFVLPIVAWVSARATRTRLETLITIVEGQQRELNELKTRLQQVRTGAPVPSEATAADAATVPPTTAPVVPPSARPAATPTVVTPATAQPPATPAAPATPPAPVAPTAPVLPREPVVSQPPHAPPVRPAAPPSAAIPPPTAPAAKPPASSSPLNAPAAPVRQGPGPLSIPSVPPPPPRPPRPPAPPEPPAPSAGFDWEGPVVKVFSAVAGIALVIAAVLFLRYSIEAGWLQPPVRVAIGVLVAIALLVACELKAARRYPATANAMDAAAIAILFATFFAAHALWNLIPAVATFILLGMVTALAVLLSIRRESIFIAVLGLLGGFATPALLSTGENRPIPLFTYLLLLNIGLAWVAYSRRWPVLTWLTLIFTVVYQWGWVFKFLDASSLPLAMGIFLVFPVAAVASGILHARGSDRDSPQQASFERSAFISAVIPLAFAVYLAAVPAYGSNAPLLFGFLLLVDLGLFAIALGRREPLLHGVGAVTTLVVNAVWLASSYEPSGSIFVPLAFTSAFSLLYAVAPAIASRLGRSLENAGARAQYAGAAILFVFPVLALVEPRFVDPWPLAGTLAALVIVIAWRAMSSGAGALYYVAAFFAIATQGVWSATHLTLERLSTAVAMYTLFGVISLAVPIVARRRSRALTPAWGSGAVLLVSLALLLFLSAGPVAPAALWALALLLAIVNAGLFVESAAGRLPIVSQIGSVLSWLLLMVWWQMAAGSVGVLPSLTVVVGLTLVTLFGHAWSVHAATPDTGDQTSHARFAQGLYLGLIGHLFLALLASNRVWALPPWPIFAALAVMTLAATAAAIWIRSPALHVAGSIAAACVVAVWNANAGSADWGMTAVLAPAAASGYALIWLMAADRVGNRRLAAAAACGALFVGDCALILAVNSGTMPPFSALVIANVVNVAIVLALAATFEWPFVAVGAIVPSWVAILQWQTRSDLTDTWPQLLTLTAALYVVFVSYPFVLGRRAATGRDPFFAAILASGMALFGARAAFVAGGLDAVIGVVPIVEGAVLAAMLRALLRLERAGTRDLGRLALVAGAALAFVTIAIPLQLEQQWITIGWALEGAALAWLYGRVPHRGLLYSAVALLGAVFVRLAMNPEVLIYEPRGSMRILNWYLYAYLICAAAFFIAAWWLSKTEDRLVGAIRSSAVMQVAGTILLFILLNIEIADFYATGATIMFRFGVTVSQDLTYTIGWLAFGLAMLAAGIYLHNRPARAAAVALIAVTTLKCFLYDLGSLGGLYRVGSLVGLAISLSLVALALQKFVLSKPRSAS